MGTEHGLSFAGAVLHSSLPFWASEKLRSAFFHMLVLYLHPSWKPKVNNSESYVHSHIQRLASVFSEVGQLTGHMQSNDLDLKHMEALLRLRAAFPICLSST